MTPPSLISRSKTLSTSATKCPWRPRMSTARHRPHSTAWSSPRNPSGWSCAGSWADGCCECWTNHFDPIVPDHTAPPASSLLLACPGPGAPCRLCREPSRSAPVPCLGLPEPLLYVQPRKPSRRPSPRGHWLWLETLLVATTGVVCSWQSRRGAQGCCPTPHNPPTESQHCPGQGQLQADTAPPPLGGTLWPAVLLFTYQMLQMAYYTAITNVADPHNDSYWCSYCPHFTDGETEAQRRGWLAGK